LWLGAIDSLKKKSTHSDSKSTAARITEENFAGGKTHVAEVNVTLIEFWRGYVGETATWPPS